MQFEFFKKMYKFLFEKRIKVMSDPIEAVEILRDVIDEMKKQKTKGCDFTVFGTFFTHFLRYPVT